MDQVFILWHTRETGQGQEDSKLIGVYGTQQTAEAAIERVLSKPGFRDTPQGFEICPYELDQDHWTEGYVTA